MRGAGARGGCAGRVRGAGARKERVRMSVNAAVGRPQNRQDWTLGNGQCNRRDGRHRERCALTLARGERGVRNCARRPVGVCYLNPENFTGSGLLFYPFHSWCLLIWCVRLFLPCPSCASLACASLACASLAFVQLP